MRVEESVVAGQSTELSAISVCLELAKSTRALYKLELFPNSFSPDCCEAEEKGTRRSNNEALQRLQSSLAMRAQVGGQYSTETQDARQVPAVQPSDPPQSFSPAV